MKMASHAAHRDARLVEDHLHGDHGEGRRRRGDGEGDRRVPREVSAGRVPGDDLVFFGRELMCGGPDVPVLIAAFPRGVFTLLLGLVSISR